MAVKINAVAICELSNRRGKFFGGKKSIPTISDFSQMWELKIKVS